MRCYWLSAPSCDTVFENEIYMRMFSQSTSSLNCYWATPRKKSNEQFDQHCQLCLSFVESAEKTFYESWIHCVPTFQSDSTVTPVASLLSRLHFLPRLQWWHILHSLGSRCVKCSSEQVSCWLSSEPFIEVLEGDVEALPERLRESRQASDCPNVSLHRLQDLQHTQVLKACLSCHCLDPL